MHLKPQLRSAFPDLRARYIDRLREQKGALTDFILQCERGSLDTELKKETQIVVHSLCGTGTTFGFPNITEAAATLEAAFDTGESPAVFIDLSRNLIRACEAVANDPAREPQADPLERDEPMPLTLFVVSTDENMGDAMARFFHRQMDVVRLPQAEAALDLFNHYVPAAVVFDMESSTNAVGQALERLYVEASRRRIPVIALAPNRRAATIASGISAGRMQTLLKPVGEDQVYESARRSIDVGRFVALLGDDDTIVRELMMHRFKWHGFGVIGAANGAQVLDLASRHQPNIIVLDRIMPGLEGLAVLKMLKTNPSTSDIPVIMLTAKRKPQDIEDGRGAGAADYIVKPFTPEFVVSRCMRELRMLN
jgi:DNA-binding response OmpR family regulator